MKIPNVWSEGFNSHEGKKLEYVLRYLEQQKCEITCAILWGADEKLAKLYYGLDNIR